MSPAQTAQKTIADVLLKKNIINQAIYEKIRLENAQTGRSIEQIIIDHNFAPPEELVKAKAEIYQIPYVNLKEITVSPEALSVLPETVAQHYLCFPYALDKEKQHLFLAMADPLDLIAIEFVEQKSKKRVIPGMALKEEVKAAIKRHYSQSLSARVTQALRETEKEEKKTRAVDVESIGRIIREAPIAKIVSTLLEFAIKARASDIHIEPQEERTRVRYRIDGILHEKLVLPKNVHEALVSRIKILSGMKIDEKRVPQDGRFSFRSGEEEVDLRVSSLPSVNGEKVVMRLLKKTGGVPSLADLGLRGRALKNLNEAIFLPHGIILITGPTGSGKTTTLYSILSKVSTDRINIITLEDPVEYEIGGINQVQTNPAAGLTFASGLRSFLRQDPDIIMVGEIRDQETANLAIQAALTGHLVFSTLHTNNAAGALPRLLDMKVEPYLLASCVVAVVGQRVVRKICPHCREEYQPAAGVLEDMKKVLGPLFPQGEKPIKLYHGRKCAECNETGYLGRIGIFEVLPVNEKISRLILERTPVSKLEIQARKDGMITMTQDGYLKALEGITTIEEVMRVSRD
jgi:type IV pilus assembly protein PilB